MAEKVAVWTIREVARQPMLMAQAVLRGGAKGTGKAIGSFHCWPSLPQSRQAARRLEADIEQEARARGYRVMMESRIVEGVGR